MACIDAYAMLCDRQVVDKIAYSDGAWDLHDPMDYGQSNIDHRICVLIEGARTTGMTIQLIAANKEDFSDAQILDSSRAYLASELVVGFRHFFTITPAGIKYRYLCLKFLPTGVEDEEETDKPDVTFCPTQPVLNPTAAPANAVSAFHCTVADYNIYYPYPNADKATL